MYVYIYIMMESTVVFVWWILGFPIFWYRKNESWNILQSDCRLFIHWIALGYDNAMCMSFFFCVKRASYGTTADIKLYKYNWLKQHHLSNPQQNLCLVLFHHSFKPPAGTQWPLFEGASQKLLSLINLYARSIELEKGEWLRRFKI